jgi:hypothetical protein
MHLPQHLITTLLQTTAGGLGLWLASQPDPAFGLRKAGQLILGRKKEKKKATCIQQCCSMIDMRLLQVIIYMHQKAGRKVGIKPGRAIAKQ